jgi:hypothetical protein
MEDRRRTATVALAWAASVALHGVVLWAWMPAIPSRQASAPAGPVLSVRLVPAVDEPPRPQVTLSAEASAGRGRPEPAQKEQPLPEVAPAARAPALDSPASAPLVPAARPERFYRAGELTHLPRLPGEPLVDLGEVPRDLDAAMALRLFIDERGHVVGHAVEDAEDMPPALVERLRRAFVGYPYVPGDIEGTPVRSEVVMRLRVREGRASALGLR